MNELWNNYRGALIPLGISAFFFYLNFAMGPTILGNVLVLFVSFLSGILSFLVAYAQFRTAEIKTAPRAIMICSGAIVVLICLLLVTDSFSFGYGP